MRRSLHTLAARRLLTNLGLRTPSIGSGLSFSAAGDHDIPIPTQITPDSGLTLGFCTLASFPPWLLARTHTQLPGCGLPWTLGLRLGPLLRTGVGCHRSTGPTHPEAMSSNSKPGERCSHQETSQCPPGSYGTSWVLIVPSSNCVTLHCCCNKFSSLNQHREGRGWFFGGSGGQI
jgi:hypothetical protein